MANEQLKVIGAGFGRTATESLQIALNKLGYNCYHMHELFKYGDDKIWHQILDTPKNERNWNKTLFAVRNYDATVDWPTTYYYEDLLKENPNAKIILTIRDTPEQWYKSVANTIYKISMTSRTWQLYLYNLEFLANSKNNHIRVSDIVWKHTFNNRFDDKNYAINIYKKHIENVQKIVPSNQLLIFNVKQGWEPLCKFLEKDVPDGPFPRSNSTKDKSQRLNKLMKQKNRVNVIMFIAVASIVGCLYRWYKQ